MKVCRGCRQDLTENLNHVNAGAIAATIPSLWVIYFVSLKEMRSRESVSKVATGASRGVNPECWLCGILKIKICDYFRKLGRETNFTDLDFLNDEMSHKFIDQGWRHVQCPVEWESGTEALMDRAEFWMTFRACLSKLPARVADVFMMREMEEMEAAQICQAFRISQNNLWVMLHRARMALRECMELNWFENKP
jgi:RNA polymerase sigma-70 factor (TIGR02943 family)